MKKLFTAREHNCAELAVRTVQLALGIDPQTRPPVPIGPRPIEFIGVLAEQFPERRVIVWCGAPQSVTESILKRPLPVNIDYRTRGRPHPHFDAAEYIMLWAAHFGGEGNSHVVIGPPAPLGPCGISYLVAAVPSEPNRRCAAAQQKPGPVPDPVSVSTGRETRD